nr:ribonuclease H-like domain-containing protein [Tanacetum cinerariifolium]
MSTQHDIYAAGSKSRPPMLNKENYVPWSSRLLRYAKSRPNGKLIHNSILNGPYVRRMIPEPEDQKPQRKDGSGSSFSSNNLTLKPNLSKFQSLRTIFAQRSKLNPSKVKSQSPRTNCVIFLKIGGDDELSEKELKQIEADDQAIQTILLGLPKYIYAAVDSCETAQEI